MSYLCPAVCLVGSVARTHGADWMHKLNSSCTFHPVATQAIDSIHVRSYPLQLFPLCVCSKGTEYVGDLTKA